MLELSRQVILADHEIDLQAVRSQGSGGQNVNKVATAIHLRFDIRASSLPEGFKEKLLALNDQRITRDGVLIIKAQSHRTQERNRNEALGRLKALIKSVMYAPKKRVATRPSKGAKQRRLDGKKKRGQHKAMRGKVET
ncbi:aminoacyl-tRNA hydrolase [Halomonas sp. DQ26W]|uniref:alternative ribosome rescue aminoacyl-tRNA hydrolase ArfB n=1 Tax=Halomonas sp. DQ26W TaxID=2282311 RepID=UPI000DF759E5|nr:alternative ribosome rescue aminoacyl-tRNA hydrolase ArfB [Halomonas sp. DQ26W]RDB42106.1 aminoacyl-tRNA hydrolase [Halomonas sp. DQ26W]